MSGDSPWTKALLLAGAKDADKLTMHAADFSSIKSKKCPRCGGLMGDVLISFGKRKAMYCPNDRVVIPYPVEE